jgi:hypothetical protein
LVQKLQVDAASPVNYVDLFEDAETGSQYSRDSVNIFFLQIRNTLAEMCVAVHDANKVIRGSSSPTYSLIQMSEVANTVLRSVIEPLKCFRSADEFAAVYIFSDQLKARAFYSFRLNYLRRVLQDLLHCPTIVLLGSACSREVHSVLMDIFHDSYKALSTFPPPSFSQGVSSSEDEICQKRDRTGSPLVPQRHLDICKQPSPLGISTNIDEVHSAILGVISKFYRSLLAENVIAQGKGKRTSVQQLPI